MADTSQSSKALLAIMPSAVALQRGKHQGARGRVEFQTVRDMMLQTARAKTRVVSGGAAVDDGGSGSTTALYRVDLAALEVLIDGVHDRAAAAADQVLVGAGQDIESYDLAGDDSIVMPSDDFDTKFAIVAFLVSGALELRAVFGDVAATGAAVAPTPAEVGASLQVALAANANADLTTGLIVARGLVARAAAAIAITGVDPDSDDGLRAEQSIGTLLNLP